MRKQSGCTPCREQSRTTAPLSWLHDTSRLESKGRSAERWIYLPGKIQSQLKVSRRGVGSPATTSPQPRRAGGNVLSYSGWGVPVRLLLYRIVPLLQQILLGESPCSELQAWDQLCLTRKGTNYNTLLVKVFIYKVALFYCRRWRTKGAAEGTFLVQLHLTARHSDSPVDVRVSILQWKPFIYLFIKLLFPHQNKTKCSNSRGVLGQLLPDIPLSWVGKAI